MGLYSDLMPTLPWLGTGLAPVAQWLLVPTLSLAWGCRAWSPHPAAREADSSARMLPASAMLEVDTTATPVKPMGLYDRLLLPRLLALGMRAPELVPYRRRVAGAASGRVLELGIGPALNLPLYGPGVTSVVGVTPGSTHEIGAADQPAYADAL